MPTYRKVFNPDYDEWQVVIETPSLLLVQAFDSSSEADAFIMAQEEEELEINANRPLTS